MFGSSSAICCLFFPWKCGSTKCLLWRGYSKTTLWNWARFPLLFFFLLILLSNWVSTPVWVTGELYLVGQVSPHLECVKAAANKEWEEHLQLSAELGGEAAAWAAQTAAAQWVRSVWSGCWELAVLGMLQWQCYCQAGGFGWDLS